MGETGDSVSVETTRLSYFAVCDVLKCEEVGPINRHTEVETCLKGCILKMLEKHEITFNGMMSRLQIDRTVDFKQGFYEIAQELFKDDVSWAKIVALFAFGARLGQYCRDNSLDDLVVIIAENLAAFANHNISPFVRSEGGWVSLCKIFPADDELENKIWRGLLLIVLGLTSAITLITLIRR